MTDALARRPRRQHDADMYRHLIRASMVMLLACRTEPVDESLRRGRDADRAQLTAAQQAGVYATALRAAFDIPGTTLLVDPRMLPAEGGYEGAGDPLPDDVNEALRRTGTVVGTCVPRDLGADRAPACPADVSGYAVRFSDVYAAGNDTVRMHLVAERYRPEADTMHYHSPFRMEERYHLHRSGNRWTVARKERMRL